MKSYQLIQPNNTYYYYPFRDDEVSDAKPTIMRKHIKWTAYLKFNIIMVLIYR